MSDYEREWAEKKLLYAGFVGGRVGAMPGALRQRRAGAGAWARSKQREDSETARDQREAR